MMKVKKTFLMRISMKKLKATPSHYQCESGSVLKKLQASYNGNTNNNVKEAIQEKSASKNLNFLINLTIVANNTKPNEDEPQMLNEVRSHPHPESCRK